MSLSRFHALPIWIFPIMLTAGILTIPVISDYSNHLLAEQAASQTARWFWGHAICGIAFGVSIMAAYSINRYLSTRGQARLGIVSLSLIAIGGILYSFGLGADGIGPLAIEVGGSRALAYFEGSGTWINGIFVTASMIFGAGLITQVIGINRSGLLKGVARVIVFLAAIIFVGAGAIPSGWGLYGVAAAAMLLYIPAGIAIWRESDK